MRNPLLLNSGFLSVVVITLGSITWMTYGLPGLRLRVTTRGRSPVAFTWVPPVEVRADVDSPLPPRPPGSVVPPRPSPTGVQASQSKAARLVANNRLRRSGLRRLLLIAAPCFEGPWQVGSEVRL